MKFFNEIKLTGEFRYYLRDLYIFLLSVFISIVIAETVIFTDSSSSIDFVDRIFVYIYIIFPLFSVALVISYLYRNFRIRQTGKVRSVIRYRLMLAFVFVSILPSIPIFFLSSNVVGRLVESFYKIDVSEALKSARENVKFAEEEEKKNLVARGRLLQKVVIKNINQPENIINRAIELNLLQTDRFYIALIRQNKLINESLSLHYLINLSSFTKKQEETYENYTMYLKDKSYLFIKVPGNLPENYVIIGKRVHVGNERNTYNIIHTENSYNAADLWKEKLPFALRLSVGIFTIIIFAVSMLVSVLLARQISTPIVELAHATQRVSRGETVQIDLKEEGEMGILIESFNQMTRDLKAKKEEMIHFQRIAAWKEVAQRMAHEIKNPLTPIQLSAERIRKRLDDPNRDKFIEIVKTGTETIIGQVRVLEHLVKEFSEFARMPAPILINQAINPIIEESVKLFIDNENINFILKLSKNLPEVFIDKRLFIGVTNNLIKNAIEAIQTEKTEKEAQDAESVGKKENSETLKAGTIKITTKLERKILRKSVVLTIEDSGPGIPPALREKIFEPYFSTKEGHGTGIGLTIVEKTVYDHRAHLSLEQSGLGGCLFRIELPVEET